MTKSEYLVSSNLYNLHPAQEDVFYEQTLYKDSTLHNIGWYSLMEDDVDIAILQQAWNLLHQHIDALRLHISIDSGHEATQYIENKSKPNSITFHDFSNQPEAEEKANLWIQQHVDIPIDLQNGPLYQASLILITDKKYYFLTKFHHIIIDGLGLFRLHEYVHRLYSCLKAETSTAWLSEIPQYLDSVTQARAYLTSDNYKQDNNYWCHFLKEHEPHQLMPYYQNHGANNKTITLPLSVKEPLYAFCEKNQSNLSSVFSCLVGIMMSALTGQQELTFNTVTHGRKTKSEKYTIGMHTNMYPVHCCISDALSVTEQIKQIESAIKRSYQHCSFPQSHLVRMANNQGFFLPNILIAYEKFSDPAAEMSHVHDYYINPAIQTHPIAFRLKDYGIDQELKISINYLQKYFSDPDVDNMFARLENLLIALIDKPSSLVNELPLLLEQEHQTLLGVWNQIDPLEYKALQSSTLQKQFEAQTAITPDNVALLFEGETLTYRQLNERANQLACVIREQYQQQQCQQQDQPTNNAPMQADTLIALYLDRSLEMVVSILAVLKAGGAYVPISPEYPSERVQFILEDTRAPCVITQQQHLLSLHESTQSLAFQPKLIAADDPSLTENQPTANLAQTDVPSDLAYVIYTSGTTGQPKGVLQTHQNVSRLFTTAHKHFQFNQKDTWVLYHTYTFDFSVWELWGALLYGGRLIIPTVECTKDFARFSQLCSQQKVTVLNQTPGAFYAFIDASLNMGAEFPDLRYVIFGGDKLNPMQLQPWWVHYGDQSPSLINMYGITETTVHVTYKKLAQNDPTASSVIGQPLNDLHAYVLNNAGHLVPIGAPGELYIGGAGLARGYLNRPELTAERFVENPFATAEDKALGYTRLYKTGDLVRWMPNGELEYLGRNDFQVKIRGYRIELGEIESALASHPQVKQAVVIDHEHKGNKVLAAYLVTEGTDGELSNDTLIRHLSSRLPDYMIPASFTRLASIPLTLNGKLDRRALPEPVWGNQDDYIAPRNELEIQLCAIWQNVLGLERIGVDDNFFRIGGNSLMAIQLIAAIHRLLAREVSLAQIFELKTVARLAAHMEQPIHTVIPHLGLQHYPLSFAQERMLFIERFEQGANVYHVPYLVQLHANASLPLLERAINRLVERHPVLKTVYRTHNDGHEYQHVLEDNLVLRPQSCNSIDALMETVRAELLKPFDLVNEPGFRLHSYTTSYTTSTHQTVPINQHYVLFLWHHIAVDGWSIDIFMDELSETYQALREERDSRLPPLDITYGDYAVWQRNYLQGEVQERQLAYWQKALTGHEPLALPTDRPRPIHVDYQGRDFNFTLDSTLSNQLRALAKAQETTLYTVLLSAFYVTLAKLSGQDDIVLGTPTDNRYLAQTQPLIGMFVNSLVLRTQLQQTASIDTLIKQVHSTLLEAKMHQDIPFEQLVDALKVERDTSRHPIFQVMFGLQNFGENLPGSHLPFSLVETGIPLYSPAKFDLSLFISDGQTNLTGSLNYATSLFDGTTITRVADIYQQVLAAFVADQQQALVELDPLSAQERHTLLHMWNQTDVPYPQDKTLQQLFEDQVEKNPDNVALVFEGETLTYHQLNERANQLAGVIRARHQQRFDAPMPADTPIALYLDRSLEMVSSILAVLKSGGAYVPILPSYPPERVNFILQDTQTQCVITQQQHLATLAEYTELFAEPPTLIAADDQAITAGQPAGNLPPINKLTDLAYIIYTSGTTGQPKGVMTEHRNVIHMAAAQEKFFNAPGRSKALMFANYIFDGSVFELFPSLFNGLTIYICSEKERHLPALVKLIQQEGIEIAALPPAILKLMTETELPSLQVLVTAGESPSLDFLEHFSRHSQILNSYGPTEVTVCATEKQYQLGDTPTNIGTAIHNARLYVLDSYGNLSPIGTPGELHVGGAGLARGYLNQPELTAERFIANPFATAEDKALGYTRLYKTGDLVRWLPNGELEYLGRNDFQVKIRGYRIELGEIENVLAAHPQVEQAAVIAHKRQGHDTLIDVLAAYLVTDSELSDESLVEYLSAHLPEYMIPASFTRLDAIPLTLNGKLDRRALPEPVWESRNSYVAPRNALESQLCAIWQAVLGLEHVGIDDNFFRIGGNSLMAIKLTAAIRQRLATDITLAQLFERKTVAGLATEMAHSQESEQQTCTVIPRLNTAHYPLSFAQERMLFIEQFEQGTDAYHIPYLVQLDNKTCLPLLEAAINQLAERHPVLKMVYLNHDDGQIHQQKLDAALPIQSIPPSENIDKLLDTVRAEIATPFDLSAEPSLRLRHYQIHNKQISEKHYLLMLWHHIAFDGWSVNIFMNELAEIYHALSAGRDSQLPPLDISYGDYAAWQRDYLQGDLSERQLAYWQQTLAGYQPLTLPTDYPRPIHVDYQGRDFNFTLDNTLSNQLRTLAKTQETTLYTVLLSAFYVTLAKLSGQDDIVLGTPANSRHHAQTQPLIGMFVNTLALRAQLQQTASVNSLIKQTHQSVTNAKSHQDMPFEQLVETLGIERDTSRHPIFQVVFTLDDFDENQPDRLNLPFSPVEQTEPLYSPAKFDLSLIVSDRHTNISGCLNYAVSLFNEATIVRLADIYQRVLTAFVADQKQALFELDVLSPQERHTLLHTWNPLAIAPYSQDQTLQQRFEAQVAAMPDNMALVFEGETLTYRELNQRANQLALVLRENYQQQHQEPMPVNTLIALYLDRGLEMVISILAVLKSGGAYVPISPEYPSDRVSFILQDAQTPCVLTQQRYLTVLAEYTQSLPDSCLMVAADDPALSRIPSGENPTSISRGDDLAYVIYTSGTTGKPKGVLQTHHNVMRLFTATQEKYQFNHHDTWVLYHAYTFDFSVWELWGALLYGGRLVIPSVACTKDFVQFSQLCIEQKVTVLNQTPGAFYAFIDTSLNADATYPRLRLVIFGGDKLNPVQLHPWWNKYGEHSPALVNMYGITETTVHVTYKRLTQDDTVTASNIGRPLNDLSAYVLDDFGRLVPIGAPGELYVGGAGLAPGYLNRPELTAERFIENPFARAEEKALGYNRLYKTGDLVRWLPNGELEYLGRNDFQVKIRGYRIELGEIESVLAAHPQVKQAVVIAHKHQSHDVLVAYLVAEATGDELSDESLVEYLSAHLPEYMIPASFTRLDAIPLTLNGKLDRQNLPEPVWESQDHHVAPRNALETQLCAIWQAVLGLERVGIHDNFFRIGGNSLMAIKLTAAIRQRLATDVTLAQLFERKTVAGLAAGIEYSSESEQQTCTVIPHLNSGHYPLSFAQERMLFIEQFEQGTDAYHIPYLVQLDNEACLPLLETAVNQLAERHSVIQMVYLNHDDGQIHQQQLDEPLVIRPAQVCEDADGLLDLVRAEIATSFDLSTEPSLRLRHYQIHNKQIGEKHYLLMLWHHIAFDGWSADIFMDELAEIYHALSAGRDSQLPPLDITYGDYAAWQRDYLQGEVGERQLAYWQQTLAGYEPLALPADHSRPAHVNYQGRDFNFTLENALSNQLRTLAKTQETTLYTVLLSAFYVMLAKLSGQDDIVLGTPTDNRHHAQTQPLIGMFVNSMALRTQLQQTASVETLIGQIHQLVAGAKAHQDMPFEQLVEALGIERDTSRHPIFQVMFTLHRFAENQSDRLNLPFSPVALPETLYSPAKFDLSLFVSDGQTNITCCLNYAVSLFNEATIVRLAGIYQHVLAAFVADQKQPLFGINILSAQERHLLERWNQTETPYPQDKTLQQLFEAQVAQHPDAIAVVFEGQKIRYDELNQRANRLAHHLIALGVRPDDRVAICLERSPEMVVGILAILKAGGGYVPLDPTYPTERLAYMLEDAAPVALLTQTAQAEKLSGSVPSKLHDKTVLLDKQAALLATLPDTNPDTQKLGLTSRHLAYVIYTSGSTGQPKGVMVEHRNILRLIINNGFADIGPDDCIAHCANTSFDAATWEIWSALLTGGRMYIVSSAALLEPIRFRQALIEGNVSALWLTVGLFNEYLETLLPIFGQLRYLIVGGDVLNPQKIRQVQSAETQPTCLLNGYGPTETTTFASTYAITSPVDVNQSIPIGRPIANTCMYLLDPYGQAVSIGAIGEIHIGGDGVARGYLNRPELTAERFLVDPFSPETDARMYKTGDLGRWLPDGNIEYLGRNDSQVKLRGFRIELGEIENVLTSHPQIRQAVVIDRTHQGDQGNKDGQGNKVLAAYLVAEDELSDDTLIKYLASRLPEYMIPASFTRLESIPLTQNGKIDRRALPEPVWGNKDNYIAPRNALETQLCAIWQAVLKLERISIDDNFFRIGGDSIVSIQLVSKLRQAGFSLQVKSIFEAPTVAQLAQWLSQSSSAEKIIAEQGLLSGEFDLLPIQQTFFNWRLSDPHHWNQAFMIQIPGDIEFGQIEHALNKLVERHDMLRTRFIETENGYRQCYSDKHDAAHDYLYSGEAPSSHSLLRYCDIRGLDKEALHQQLTQWQSGFDYNNGPLWQAGHLTGYADGSARLFFAFHHLIIDAVSWRIIAEDMRLLLQGMSLPPKTSSYRQWVAAIHRYAQQHQHEVSYWKHVVAGNNIMPATVGNTQHRLSLSAEMTDILLHEANTGYHTEINDLLLSALTLTLQETFSRTVNYILLEGHGRESIDSALDLSETVGWFTTMYPVRLEMQADIAETIIHTKEMLRDIPNKGIGYSALHQAGYLTGELPTISFNYLGQLGGSSHQDWTITSDDCGDSIARANGSHLLLGINGAVQAGKLQFNVDSRLPQPQTEVFLRAFEQALNNIVVAGQTQAQSGGIKTPSDFGIKGISMEQLNQLTHQFDLVEDESSPLNSEKKTILDV
ncbi:Amino acid adenylation [Xenorhabdus mauleonii]|uniref:Amino acid adenylation n=1 Tax=Xenorhabdus mauleonii TaxID=351675 RepID=A0A1I3T9F2_9GAMM|nr:non-ribosomal peptide synthetase [Xenorhabdus mauleonii]PHM39367.1 Amino acid adenylation [Xenorhabdus mauleonii]SFJ66296.1 non-ribosomal peptide synthase domain TIGR01720/amino acid adenylation domain-containing protein [Xenorhabdus mauleonii]